MKTIQILGLTYRISEVECVNKEELRRGEINFLTNEIRIDQSLPEDLKGQVLVHEVLHAIFDLLGYEDLCSDENKVQGIATALYELVQSNQRFFLEAAMSSSVLIGDPGAPGAPRSAASEEAQDSHGHPHRGTGGHL